LIKKEIGINFAMTVKGKKGKRPIIVLNEQFLVDHPEEIPHIIETLVEELSHASRVENSINLSELDSNTSLLLPYYYTDIIVRLKLIVDGEKGVKPEIKNFRLLILGFCAVLENLANKNIVKLNEIMEETRALIIQTVIEARLYGDTHESQHDIEKIFAGFSNLQDRINDPGKRFFYIKEALCLEFLTKYFNINDNSDVEPAGIESKLAFLLKTLSTKDLEEFLYTHNEKQKSAFFELYTNLYNLLKSTKPDK
jgi:hypothetical protein